MLDREFNRLNKALEAKLNLQDEKLLQTATGTKK